MPELAIAHEKARSFYPVYERKAEAQHQTHYCPGCGHGIAHKLIAKAIDDLGLQDRTVFVSPVGCSVFAYYYFDVGNVQAAHGRAAAVATAVKRSRPDSIVISYQGDGDLAAIGSAEILAAANRGENITVFFVNNAIYGMTGGQMAPTTILGARSTTSPYGRNAFNEGYPLKVAELLASLDAPVYIERVALSGNRGIMAAAKAVRKALDNQVRELGFSLVEILSPCPTIWKMDPVPAQKWVAEELTKVFPPGVYRDRVKEAAPRPRQTISIPEGDLAATLGIRSGAASSPDRVPRSARSVDLRVKIAGFGGQGVLLLGQALAESGMDAGLEVSWLPSYGPEMRSGTSNCHVRVSHTPVDSPLVATPNVLIALNEPSLRKFIATVEPGGLVLYNGFAPPEDCARKDVRWIAVSFSDAANRLGDARCGNMVALGALLEATGALDELAVDRVLQRLVKGERWLALDRQAIAQGKVVAREVAHVV